MPERVWPGAAALLVCAGSVGQACAQAAPPAPPVLPDAPAPWVEQDGVARTRLPNGMTLLVRPDHRAPTAVHMLWVRVGSMDETDGTSGVAHVLEHMMFKGSAQMGPGDYSRRVAAMGGRDNAFTSRDATVYHQQVPADRLRDVMCLEADRFATNRWDDTEFRRELEVIKEERRLRVDDQPRAMLYESLAATAWLAHPYRRPVIGWQADLDSLQPDDARAFYQRWYVPANAAIVVAGDVTPQQALTWAMACYGPLPARAVPVRKPQAEPEQRGMRQLALRAPAEQTYVALAYRAPRLSQPDGMDPDNQDALALTLLAAVLDGYDGARLGRALVQAPEAQRLATQVGAGYSGTGRGPAQFTLDATVAPGRDVADVVAALKAQVAKVVAEGVSATELARVRNQWRAAEVYRQDALFAQARTVGADWLADWPLDARRRLMDNLMRVTPAQVQAVAARYVRDDQLTLAVLTPDAQALAERRAAAAQRPVPALRH